LRVASRRRAAHRAATLRYEHSYEQVHRRLSRRLSLLDGREDASATEVEHRDQCSTPHRGWLKLDFPEVERVARFNETWRTVATDAKRSKSRFFERRSGPVPLLAIHALAGRPAIRARSARPHRDLANHRAQVLRTASRCSARHSSSTATSRSWCPRCSRICRQHASELQDRWCPRSATPTSPREDLLPATNHRQHGALYLSAIAPGRSIDRLRAQLPQFMTRHFGMLKGIIRTAAYCRSPTSTCHRTCKRALRPRGNPHARCRRSRSVGVLHRG
jgi:hypothetical protein